MLQENKESISRQVEKYRKDVAELARYRGWLESRSGQDLTKLVDPAEGKQPTMQVPVYDSTLLAFVKSARKTAFIDRNYMYTYRRLRIKDADDELRQISRVQIMEIEVLGAILSSYILKGQTKGTVWNEGVRNGVYLAIVDKMQELIDFWTA
ncbi:MAG: hypothetical protein K5697_12920 [Lachnospiraceae bacterium]|nr:hypothetical protein [Lachnospiraceae bacterium]